MPEKNKLQNEKLKVDDTKNGLINFFTNRLNHPYLGTYIISFTIINFNDILKLIFGLNDDYSDYVKVINDFTSEFYLSSPKVLKPFIPTLLFPLFINQWGKILLELSTNFFDALYENIKNFSKRIEYKNQINNLTKSNFNKDNMISDLNKEYDVLLNHFSILATTHYKVDNAEIYKSELTFKAGDYVSRDRMDYKLIEYTDSQEFVGIVLLKIKNGVYLVTEPTPEFLSRKIHEVVEEFKSKNLQKLGNKLYIYYTNSDGFSVSTERKANKSYFGTYDNHTKIFKPKFILARSISKKSTDEIMAEFDKLKN